MRPVVIVACSLFPIVASLSFNGSVLSAEVDMKEVKFFIRYILDRCAKLSFQTIT